MSFITIEQKPGVENPQDDENIVIDENGRKGIKWFNWWSGRSGVVWEDEDRPDLIDPRVINHPH